MIVKKPPQAVGVELKGSTLAKTQKIDKLVLIFMVCGCQGKVEPWRPWLMNNWDRRSIDCWCDPSWIFPLDRGIRVCSSTALRVQPCDYFSFPVLAYVFSSVLSSEIPIFFFWIRKVLYTYTMTHEGLNCSKGTSLANTSVELQYLPVDVHGQLAKFFFHFWDSSPL